MADADRLQIDERVRRYDGWVAIDEFRLKHRRFDGGWTRLLTRTVVRRGVASVVLPYDPTHDRVVLIEQFRPGAIADRRTPWLIEAVAGLVEGDTSPEAAARRELAEEAGLEAHDLVPLWEGYASPGFADEYIHGFVARVDSAAVGGHHGVASEDEDIRPFVLSFDDAMAWWRAQRLLNVPLVTTLLALATERPSLRERWIP